MTRAAPTRAPASIAPTATSRCPLAPNNCAVSCDSGNGQREHGRRHVGHAKLTSGRVLDAHGHTQKEDQRVVIAGRNRGSADYGHKDRSPKKHSLNSRGRAEMHTAMIA